MSKRGAGVFNTEAQERFAALLVRAGEVVPFNSDEECQETFLRLADACSVALANKEARSAARFADMSLEELVALARREPQQEPPVGAGKRRRDEEEAEAEGEPEVEAGEQKWRFEQAYNIVSICSIQDEDDLSIRILARPPVAGNQKPVLYAMDGSDFDSISVQRGRNGTKLRNTFLAALQHYASTCNWALPERFLARLKRYDWSKALPSEWEAKRN